MNISLKELLWRSANVDIDLISECSSVDKGRYLSLGVLVVVAATLASFSFGYAVYLIFNNMPLSLFVALVWGLLVFNLDRSIVSAIKPTDNLNTKLTAFIPRLLLGTFVALTVSHPLLLKIFEDDLLFTLEQQKIEEAIKQESIYRAEFEKVTRYREESVQKLMNEITLLEKNLNSNAKIFINLRDRLNCEKYSDGSKKDCRNIPHSGIPTLQPITDKDGYPITDKDGYQKYRKVANAPKTDDLQRQLKENRKEKSIYENRRRQLERQIRQQNHTSEKEQRNLDSLKKYTEDWIEHSESEKFTFLSRSKVLFEMSFNDMHLGFSSLLIFLTLFTIELLPGFIKLLSPVGEYDLRQKDSEEAFTAELKSNRIERENIGMVREGLIRSKPLLDKIMSYKDELEEKLLSAMKSRDSKLFNQISNNDEGTINPKEHAKLIEEILQFYRSILAGIAKDLSGSEKPANEQINKDKAMYNTDSISYRKIVLIILACIVVFVFVMAYVGQQGISPFENPELPLGVTAGVFLALQLLMLRRSKS